MAKRKRLTPAQAGFLSGPAPEVKSAHPPIAQVAGDAAAVSALSTLSSEWETARAEGRLVLSLALEDVVGDHLVRDRAALDNEAMDSLKQSLSARGQQTPIEVLELPEGGYGLISGWRRLTALRQLRDETGEDRFGTVQALIRRPADLADSYVAMVEENEIRSDLSFYERARIVIKALEAGVFETEKEALNSLFATGSYARRSKIKSFIPVVQALEGALRFPERMSERTGLALSKALVSDPETAATMRATLDATPPETAEAETASLLAVLKPADGTAKNDSVPEKKFPPRARKFHLEHRPGEIVLSGPGVTRAFRAQLRDWLISKG